MTISVGVSKVFVRTVSYAHRPNSVATVRFSKQLTTGVRVQGKHTRKEIAAALELTTAAPFMRKEAAKLEAAGWELTDSTMNSARFERNGATKELKIVQGKLVPNLYPAPRVVNGDPEPTSTVGRRRYSMGKPGIHA